MSFAINYRQFFVRKSCKNFSVRISREPEQEIITQINYYTILTESEIENRQCPFHLKMRISIGAETRKSLLSDQKTDLCNALRFNVCSPYAVTFRKCRNSEMNLGPALLARFHLSTGCFRHWPNYFVAEDKLPRKEHEVFSFVSKLLRWKRSSFICWKCAACLRKTSK